MFVCVCVRVGVCVCVCVCVCVQSLGTPWMQFMKSKAVWANHIGFGVTEWGRYLILTQLPTYMHDVLHVNITQV